MPCGNMITIPIYLSGVGECLPQSTMLLPTKVLQLPWAYVPTEIIIAIKMKELWRRLSPRLSVSYRLVEGLTLSGHVGLYYQLPSYTALGFKGEEGEYVNRHLDYISVSQESLGLSWTPNENMELSVEGFYKLYGHMPFSLSDQIPLSCKGNDYGTNRK